MGQLLDGPQDTAGPLFCHALLTPVELAIDQDLQVPFCGNALPHLILQSAHTSRIASSHLQNPTLAFVKLHMVGGCLAFSFVEVS